MHHHVFIQLYLHMHTSSCSYLVVDYIVSDKKTRSIRGMQLKAEFKNGTMRLRVARQKLNREDGRSSTTQHEGYPIKPFCLLPGKQ